MMREEMQQKWRKQKEQKKSTVNGSSNKKYILATSVNFCETYKDRDKYTKPSLLNFVNTEITQKLLLKI